MARNVSTSSSATGLPPPCAWAGRTAPTRPKVTTSEPLPFRKSRRVVVSMVTPSAWRPPRASRRRGSAGAFRSGRGSRQAPGGGAEPFQRDEVPAGGARDRDDARAGGGAVEQHRAGAALPEPAAELRAVQGEVVAQHVEQRSVGLDVEPVGLAVDRERDHRVSLHVSGT